MGDKLSDIAKIEREMLTPRNVAGFLHMNPYALNVMARDRGTDNMPFPCFFSGNRLKIPKNLFLQAFGWKGGET
jgi:hypothetical protein